MESVSLPAPWSGPLPLINSTMLLVVAVMLAAMAVLALLAWLSPVRPPVAAPVRRPALPAPLREMHFTQRLRQLQTRHVSAGTFREGTHELAWEVRLRLEEQGAGAKAMTADELMRAWDDDVGAFLAALREARFGIEGPDRRRFERLCDEAAGLLGGTRSRGRRR